MSLIRSVAVLSVAALAVAAAPARHTATVASPLAGKWHIEYERGRMNMNGDVHVIMGSAVIDLAERGDSLVGTLTPEADDSGQPAAPATAIGGQASGSGATLQSTSTVRINNNGDEQQVTVTLTWKLTASGDNLSGTMSRSARGMDVPNRDVPVKGTRMK
ncbi:MAG TPA: hypothetical protein VG916_13365 [Gemmatimonadaceae bacterium]|nr:hypothetical protein [Gemmatimonadaceae bacterium]